MEPANHRIQLNALMMNNTDPRRRYRPILNSFTLLLLGWIFSMGPIADHARAGGVLITDANPMRMPAVGDYGLRVLSPTVLELTYITTKAADPATVTEWNFVSNNNFTPPPASAFTVTVNGQTVPIQSMGFKRRPLYAPLKYYDLRIGNYLYIQIPTPLTDGQTVQVTNPNGAYWSSDKKFSATADPLRVSPAIHVNQEGYMPNYVKKAMVGYYLGNMGEMSVSATTFKLVDVNTGAAVYSGNLTSRKDVGYTYSPLPYQQVLEADFSNFNTPGEYRLQVPGLGASLPFMIDPGIAALFARTYALGLYHQRCGHDNDFPFTRFLKGACHSAPVAVPDMSYGTVNRVLAQMTADYAYSQAAGTPQLKDVNSSLFPFVNKGPIDLKGGHHDAGDYSKYTINVAQLAHTLLFAADAFPGVAALDNLGLPESGDGKCDVLQIAKWELDFLVRMQDADGGFYFLVYPRDREYEDDLPLVSPYLGDPQVVFPKTTAVTASSVGALAEAGSSPLMKQLYPTDAAKYMAAAKKGWTFLQNAIARYGRNGCYQKITHYGNAFGHNDELAWAAAAMYAATGESVYHNDLMSNYDPSDPNTLHWSWWHMFEGYGCAVRTYAFAARTGRLQPSQLNSAYLAKCEQQILAAGDDQVRWTQHSAYANSFSDENKPWRSAGWFFSVDQTFDMATAYQVSPKQDYLDAIVGAMNYEAGCNPVNMGFVTGVGWKRQRETVNQYAQNDRRVLPPTGIPLGSVQSGFTWLYQYGSSQAALTFPSDSTVPIYAPYDKWADTFNTMTEFVNPQQAHSLAAMSFMMARSPLKTQAWKSATAQIQGLPASVPAQEKITATLSVPGLDMSKASFVWEARDQEPTPGAAFTFAAVNPGPQWVEVEATLPDGRRVFAATNFNASTAVNTPPNSYQSAPLSPTSDMVALYHLDSTYADATGKQGALTKAGNGALDASNIGWMATRSGSSFHSSDLGDQATVSIPNSAIYSADTKSISIEAMIYINGLKAYNRGNAEILALQKTWGSSLELYENIYNGLCFRGGSQMDISGTKVSGSLPRNTWHHLRITLDKTGYTVRVNGNVVASQPSTELANWAGGSSTLTIGNFDGWIDEVVVRSEGTVAPPPNTAPTVSLTAPANGAVVTMPNTVTLSATASDSDGTVAKVEFYQGATKIGEDTTSPYSITWSPAAAGSYSLTAKAIDNGGATKTSSAASITVKAAPVGGPVPAPWANCDIGNVVMAGKANFTNNTYTVSGGGADIWDVADAFQYVYQPFNGDGEIVARVSAIQVTDPWSKAGVMFRESLDANSRHVSAFLTGSNGTAFQRRLTTGGLSLHTPIDITVAAPYWFKLVRTGNTFTAYSSMDGTTWTAMGSETVAMAANIYVGLAVTAHTTTAVNTSTFTDVRTSGGSVQPPVGGALPVGWAGKDIGSVAFAGSATHSNGTYYVNGSGDDIWNTVDGFQYAYMPWSGDGEIVARVVSLQQTDPWSKAGVMFRENLESGSKHASTFLTSANGTAFQCRQSASGISLHYPGQLVPAPYWVRLVRSGNVFTGFASSNGTNWTQIASNTVSMSSNIYVGLAVTAHTNNALNRAVFSDVRTNSTVSTPPTGGVLPAPWVTRDIGSVSLTGTATYTNGTFRVSGSGDDIWNSADAFRFVYQPLNGDGEIVARVNSVQNTDPWAKAAIMIRETLDAGSVHAMAVLSASSGNAFQFRLAPGTATYQTWGYNVTAPYWIKLTRVGNVFTGYMSTDGNSWTRLGSQAITMGASAFVGLAVTAHNNSALNTSVFSNVSVTNAPAPVWSSQDIGAVGQTGSMSSANNIYTLKGSGADIWETADGFHMMYQKWTGDGSIVARVDNVQNTDPWAKAGVMFRETLTAGSPHVFSVITSANGAAFQRRFTQGGYSLHTQSQSVKAPYWVRVTRIGDVFTGAISADGITWTTTGSETVRMASTLYVGVAVTAHNNTALNTSAFSNVRLGSN